MFADDITGRLGSPLTHCNANGQRGATVWVRCEEKSAALCDHWLVKKMVVLCKQLSKSEKKESERHGCLSLFAAV